MLAGLGEGKTLGEKSSGLESLGESSEGSATGGITPLGGAEGDLLESQEKDEVDGILHDILDRFPGLTKIDIRGVLQCDAGMTSRLQQLWRNAFKERILYLAEEREAQEERMGMAASNGYSIYHINLLNRRRKLMQRRLGERVRSFKLWLVDSVFAGRYTGGNQIRDSPGDLPRGVLSGDSSRRGNSSTSEGGLVSEGVGQSGSRDVGNRGNNGNGGGGGMDIGTNSVGLEGGNMSAEGNVFSMGTRDEIDGAVENAMVSTDTTGKKLFVKDKKLKDKKLIQDGDVDFGTDTNGLDSSLTASSSRDSLVDLS